MDETFIWGLMVLFVLLALYGWIFFFVNRNEMEDMVTTLPNGCILYEEKIWCEEVSE